MLNIKDAQSPGLYKAFNSSQNWRHKLLGNRYKALSTIIFIDSAVDDYQSLVNGAIPEAEVIVLDSTRDGVVQITEVLQGRINIAAIHIVSHGAPGSLQLGNSQLSLDTLDHYATQLKTWSATLSHIPLLLYGCNVAAGDAGAQFIERFHRLTGADIAASAKRTGCAALGGDWELEVATSKIDVPLAFRTEVREAYASVLATITVDTLIDENDHSITDGDISLRDAIELASAGDTIDFSVSGIIKLDLTQDGQPDGQRVGELVIDKNLTIDGPGADKLTISGDNKSRVFFINNADNLINVEIEGLTIAEGNVEGEEDGGGIRNYEDLTITNSIVKENKAGDNGGGIRNELGKLLLTNSIVSDNTAKNDGGGIDNDGGEVTLTTGSRVLGNTAEGDGGGIRNREETGKLNVIDSIISGNTANDNGGGIVNKFGSTVTLTRSTVENNIAADEGGGIANEEKSTLLVTEKSTIRGNTVRGESGSPTTGVAGGILNEESTLIVRDSTISGNTAPNGGSGIFNEVMRENSTVELINSTISDNRAGIFGGGIFNDQGNVTVTNSNVSSNLAVNGGGIFNNGTLNLTDSIVSSNSASGVGGGAIENVGDGQVTLTNTTVSGNSAQQGGGIENFGDTVTLLNSTVSGNSAVNSGGGIHNGSSSTVTLTNSTVSGNSAVNSGGGIENFGILNLTNSTVSGNSASNIGGGIDNSGTATVTNSTVFGNSANFGGGINNFGTTEVGNTIIAGNTAGTGPDVRGNFNDQGNNLIGNNTGSSGFTVSTLVGTSTNPIDPLLGPLQDNGGPTFTHALLDGSPAINAGNNANIPVDITTDQRGEPRIVGGTVDIGAFEAALSSPIVICTCEQNGDPWSTTNNHQVSAFSTGLDANLITAVDCWV